MTTSQSYSIKYSAETQTHMKFRVLLGCFLFMIFARNILGMSIPIAFLLVFSAIIALFSSKTELIALAISYIPLSSGFQYKYGLIVCIIIYIVKFNKRIKLTNAAFPLLLMMMWEFFHAFTLDFSFAEYFRQFTEMIFCTFLMCIADKNFDFKLIVRVLSVCTIFAGAVVLLNLLKTSNYNFQSIFLSGKYRFGTGDTEIINYGMNYNANSYGFMCIISIIGILQLIRKKQQATIDYIIIGVLSVMGLLTLSRAYVVCYAFIILMYLLLNEKSLKKNLVRIASILFAIALVYIVINRYAPYLLDNILARFKESDVTNGRTDIFTFYNKHIFASIGNLFFGTGLQNVWNKMSLLYGTSFINVPHNGIQELVVVWGLVGLVFFIYYVLAMIWSSESIVPKHTIANYYPLLVTLLMVQSGQLISSGTIMLIFAFIYISLCTNMEVAENL